MAFNAASFDGLKCVIVTTTRLYPNGADVLEGPQALLAVKVDHCPAWLAGSGFFNAGELIEDEDEDAYKELRTLLNNGHAFFIPHVRHIHMSAKAFSFLGAPNDDSDSPSEDEEEEGNASTAKKQKTHNDDAKE